VIHYTAMASAQAAIERLCDPVAEVSAHYVIANSGIVTQLVAEEERAWHAGVGQWHGQDDINSRSIGIELDNDSTHPFSEPLMHSLESLLPMIMQRWDIPKEGVIGHSDFAPGRKIDPGPKFDWQRLAAQDLARATGKALRPEIADWSAFRNLAQSVGYPVATDDETLLATIRLRYRPWAHGALTADDFVPLSALK
jgi:N-acetylmuramoyl-L-alanine amidase